MMQMKTPADQEQVVADIQKEILSFNREFAERYNLAKPRSISLSVAEDIVSALRYIGVVEYQDGMLSFSSKGTQLANFLEISQAKEFRNEITRLMLDRFPEIRDFLVFLYRSTVNEELVLPKITVELLESLDWDLQMIATRITEAASMHLKEPLRSRLSKLELQEKLNLPRSLSDSKKAKSLETIVDQYLISKLMGPSVTSKRKYDVIRDQSNSLFLVNSGFFKEEGFSFEAVYLTSWFHPDMTIPANIREFNDLVLPNGKTIRIHEPNSDDSRMEFKKTVMEVYRKLEPEFGFVEISDIRNHVCRVLRISDRLFDAEIVRLHQEDPDRFGLSYSFRKVTSKRLPILIGDTLKRSYNLVRVS